MAHNLNPDRLDVYPLDLKVSYTFYSNFPNFTAWPGDFPARYKDINRHFYLRNLEGDTETQQIDHAKRLVNEIAEELYYISGCGLRKAVLKQNGKIVETFSYANFTPQSIASIFHGLKFIFHSPLYKVWMKDGNWQAFPLSKKEALAGGWELTNIPYRRTVSFTIPIIYNNSSDKPEDHQRFFDFDVIPYHGRRGRRRRGRRRNFSLPLIYDRQDLTYKRFINRFGLDGTLCFYNYRDIRYFTENDNDIQLELTGLSVPVEKLKNTSLSALARKPSDDTDFVYLIRMGRTKMYKIGISNDPEKRLDRLQTASPYKLKLLNIFPADNATAAEEKLHAVFHGQRKEGEWFSLTDEQRAVIEAIKAYREGRFRTDDPEVDISLLT